MLKVHCKNCPAWSKCFFQDLKDHEIHYLDEVKLTFSLGRKGILNEKGKPVDYVYCIQSGYSKITWPDENFSKESIVKIVGPGDLTGYRCIFSESSYRATAIALEPITVCKIPKDFFMELMISNPKFNMNILNKMGIEIRRAEEKLHSFCSKDVRERLAECLINLYYFYGEEINNQKYIKVKLNRNEIASLIGTAKETVVRTLAAFKEEKLIDQNENFLIITNLDKLQNLSNNIH
jgi:CRP-like cAMP-binding protein